MKRPSLLLLLTLVACTEPKAPTIQGLRHQVTYCAFESGTTKTTLDIKFDYSGWITAYTLYWTPATVNGATPSKLEDFKSNEVQVLQITQFGKNQDINLPKSGSGTLSSSLLLTANDDKTVNVALVGAGHSGRVWVQAFNGTLASGVLRGDAVSSDPNASTCDPAESSLR